MPAVPVRAGGHGTCLKFRSLITEIFCSDLFSLDRDLVSVIVKSKQILQFVRFSHCTQMHSDKSLKVKCLIVWNNSDFSNSDDVLGTLFLIAKNNDGSVMKERNDQT